MTTFNPAIDLDGQGRPLYGFLPFRVKKTITFIGGTANAIGNFNGTGDPFTVFPVTGDVQVMVVAVCKTTLVGATATIELGVTGATPSILAVITATNLVVNEAWNDATPTLAEARTPQIHIIGGGLDIIGNIEVANITAGVIDFYCFWRPLSDAGLVEAA